MLIHALKLCINCHLIGHSQILKYQSLVGDLCHCILVPADVTIVAPTQTVAFSVEDARYSKARYKYAVNS